MQYSKKDELRVVPLIEDKRFPPESYRLPWRRDFARLIHSPGFRRLQGKCQLFPISESDFFRNRLTHSLEVAQIAKSLAIRLNYELSKKYKKYYINEDLIEFAGLGHDLGHPPFGHFGELVLDSLMKKCGGFESNAQTLRILTKLEKRQLNEDTILGISHKDGKDLRVGLNLCYRTLASILKYDNEIPLRRSSAKGVEKGYYASEKQIVEQIKLNVCKGKTPPDVFKTIECKIMDLADDIAYSTYDLEDSFKAGFLKPIDLLKATPQLEKVTKKINDIFKKKYLIQDIQKILHQLMLDTDLFVLFEDINQMSDEDVRSMTFTIVEANAKWSDEIAANSYLRTGFTSKLVGRFIRSIKLKAINRDFPSLSDIKIDEDKAVEMEILKRITFEYQISSPKLKMSFYRAQEILSTIFEKLTDEKIIDQKGADLLPADYKTIHDAFRDDIDKRRTICDFIAGMTDRYALEFYGRLKSVNPQTIFKPIY